MSYTGETGAELSPSSSRLWEPQKTVELSPSLQALCRAELTAFSPDERQSAVLRSA